MDDAIATWPAHRQAAAIAAKDVSSRELLELFLTRIERINPPLNAVITLDVDRAWAAADAADDDTTHGRSRGPLHGLPITIKDAIEVGGIRSTGGAVELADHVPAADAVAVAKLKAAGAVVFGKTNVPRWSGDLQTYNEIFGTTNNPWNHARSPGGSSGGAATAVAAGLTAFELGTDIGGSVRVPSHCTGVWGLKPSFGVIPQRGYLDHVGGGTTDADINVFGPIARDPADLDLLLGVLAGPEPARAVGWRLELPPPGRETYRIGTWFDEPGIPIDSGMRAMLQGAADAMAGAGHKVEEAHPPVDFAEQVGVFNNLIVGAISPSMEDALAEALGGSHRQWLRMDQQRARLQSVWAEWFTQYDILLCPVMPRPAIEHNQEGSIWDRTCEIDGGTHPHLNLVVWAGLIGVVGLPSAVPPLGRTSDGMPVGVQVVAPYLHDRRAIDVARRIAEVTPGAGYTPPPGC